MYGELLRKGMEPAHISDKFWKVPLAEQHANDLILQLLDIKGIVWPT